MKNKSNILNTVVIALKLLIICAIIALIVAFVNSITYKKIEDNNRQKTEIALKEIYGEDSTYEELTYKSKAKEFNVIYKMFDHEKNILGYCASVSPNGFKDVIGMLVATDDEQKIIAVKITSLSDTKGIGTKVQNETFLNSFIGKNGNIPYSSSDGGVDTIAGATKSSKPVILGANIALKEISSYLENVEEN